MTLILILYIDLDFNHDINILSEFPESNLYRKVLSHKILVILVQTFYLEQALK